MDPSTLLLFVIIAAGLIVLSIFFTFVPVMLWISALAAGVRVSIFTCRNEASPSDSKPSGQPAHQSA